MSTAPRRPRPASQSDSDRGSPTPASASSPGCSTSTGSNGSTSPRSFDIEWDREATSSSGSRPTSTCRQYDLYIEITTLNQKLVTKKNRKVRRLRERYPEVKCKIFYQRDYLSLVTKYGLEDASG